MSKTRLAPTTVTLDQRTWLDSQSEKTGDSIASIIRGLIQAQVNKEARKKWNGSILKQHLKMECS